MAHPEYTYQKDRWNHAYRKAFKLAKEAGLVYETSYNDQNLVAGDFGPYRIFFNLREERWDTFYIWLAVPRQDFFGRLFKLKTWMELKTTDEGPFWKQIDGEICNLGNHALAVLRAKEAKRKADLARGAGVPATQVPGALSMPEELDNRGNLSEVRSQTR